MSALELAVKVEVVKDLAGVVWASKQDHSSTVAGEPSYWVLRYKYCPENTGSECFTGNCEFAKKYPGSGRAKPCLEFVRKMEADKSVAAAVLVTYK